MLLELLTAATIVAGNPEVPVVAADALPPTTGTRSHSHTHSRNEIDENQPPLLLEVTYTAEAIANVSGGIKRRTKYLDNLDVVLEADMERLFGWSGAELHLYGLYNNGHSISSDVGDSFAVSNIEADGRHNLRLYEAWIAQKISPTLSVKAGLYDLNSEFDSLDAAGLFTGSAHGIGVDFSQSGTNGPSIFPNTSLAIRVEKSFLGGGKIRAAILDGVPADPARPGKTAVKLRSADGILTVAELETPVTNGKLLLGHWRYSAKFDNYSGTRSSGNAGFYLRGETGFTKFGDTRVDIFARVGTASGDHNMFDFFASAGVRFSGLITNEDEAGLAFAMAKTSKGYRLAQGAEQREAEIELTYRKQVHSNVTLQPTIQYILNPSADPLVEDALLIGVRSEFAFRF